MFLCVYRTVHVYPCVYQYVCVCACSGTAKAWVGAYFGAGVGRVLLDEVSCTGNELSIEQCPKTAWGEHNCDHTEDAGVSCTPLTGITHTHAHIKSHTHIHSHVFVSASQTVRCAWWAELEGLREGWRFTIKAAGEQCVMTAGQAPTHRSSADNWATGHTHTHTPDVLLNRKNKIQYNVK